MKQRVLALGFFDGVHLGHGALLRRTKEVARQRHLTAAALTFDVHPDTVVRGENVPLLNTAGERAALMQSLYGIEELITLRFDRATMEQPWQDFVQNTLSSEYHAAHVVCGEDFRFGARGEGTAQKLKEQCEAMGMGCDIIPQVNMDGQVVSSTAIRKLLEQGEMAQAIRFLGHPHIISGAVQAGKQLGRTLGIPTANLRLAEGLLVPKFGVYGGTAKFDGLCLPAVVNIGVRPTVGGETVTVEPWILDFNGDLYGHSLVLELTDFLRPEQKFPSLEALRSAILRDAEKVRKTVG